jgi:endonuclease G
MKKFIIIFVAIVLFFSLIIGRCNDAEDAMLYGDETCDEIIEPSINQETDTIIINKDENEELPQEQYVDNSVEIPAKSNSISEQIIKKKAFTASYNQDTKCPNWVAWRLSSEHTDGPYKRMGNFHEEDKVPTPKATLLDYRGSGWSRGHMCPAGDNKWDEQAMFESFSLVNVCPQNARLNSGVWNSIEMDCRKWAKRYGEVYIVCGPVYMNKEHEVIGENEVVVPEAFFKVVLCLTGKPKAMGIVVKNTEGTKKKDLYYNSVDQVERITGYDFFPSLPDDIENKVEAKANINDW